MPEVIAYMKSKDPKPSIITVIITEKVQKICKENDIEFWGISAELYDFLANKVKVVDLLKKANIPYIPNVCSRIESY
jgi:biotin carboxylase